MPIIERLLVPLSVVVAAAGMALLMLAATATPTTASPAPATVPTTTVASARPEPPPTTTTTTDEPSTTTTTEPPVTTTTPPDPPPSPVDTVIAFARAQVGKPYVRGAAGPAAFDCSGLTLAAYRTIDVDLPHYSVTQADRGRPVDWRREPIRPGDLVFMRGDTPEIDLGHVGLAISDREWIVAPRSGQRVHVALIPTDRVQRVRRIVDG